MRIQRVRGRGAPKRCLSTSGRFALLGLALIALTACGDAPGATTGQPPAATARASAATGAPIAFPQLAPTAGARAQLTAGLRGTLSLTDGCLRVTTVGGANYLLIWPPEVALRVDGGDIRVIAADGRVMARVGERVDAGGGELPTAGNQLATAVRSALRETPPARCPGPYWLIEFIAPGRGLLDGSIWSLAALDGAAPVAGTAITLNFVAGRIDGFDGCNGYAADYAATHGGALTISHIGGTAAGCPTPALAAQERRYLDLLRAATAYRWEGAQLRLETADGRALICTSRAWSSPTPTAAPR